MLGPSLVTWGQTWRDLNFYQRYQLLQIEVGNN